MAADDCPFCRIAADPDSVHPVLVTEGIMAFPDRGPIRRGHLQIAPRQHVETFEDLDAEIAAEILWAGQRLARVLKRLYRVPRVAFLFTGGDIPHAHAHLVPMVEKTDITSRRYITDAEVTFAARPRATQADLSAVASEIRAAARSF
ncbi:MAG: HIT family protein [Pseudomonadota bacterium]